MMSSTPQRLDPQRMIRRGCQLRIGCSQPASERHSGCACTKQEAATRHPWGRGRSAVHPISPRKWHHILSVNRQPPPAHLQGWKEVVSVEEKAELLVAFNRPATRQDPFMYHCHVLEHEDAGMMGQYICI
jgi:hypothetical protein